MNQMIKNRIAKINRCEVPKGYKKTDNNLFPCDWQEKALGELFIFSGSLSAPRDQLGDEGIPYLHYGDMHRSDTSEISYADYSDLPKYNIQIEGKEKFLMADGDIAFLDASEDLQGTSRSVLIDNPDNLPFLAGLHTLLAKEKSTTLVKQYKKYFTLTQFVQRQFERLAAGFKVYGINRDSIIKIKVAVPTSSSEQQRIAEILMKWDEAVELQEKFLDLYILQKNIIVERIFHHSTQRSKIKIQKLIIQRTERNSFNCDNVLSVNNKLGFIQQEEQFDKIVASKNLSNYKVVRKFDIAYNPSRINVGSIAINETDIIGIVSPMYIVFRCNDKIDTHLFLEILNTARIKHYIKSSLSGSVRDSLNFDDLCEIEIAVPSAAEQLSIKKTLSLLSKNINLQMQKLEALKKQRKVLRQLLLTGIVRV